MVRNTIATEQREFGDGRLDRPDGDGPITNGKRASHSLPILTGSRPVAASGVDGLADLVQGVAKEDPFNLAETLLVIRRRYADYRKEVERALEPKLAMGALLARIKAGIRDGAPGFADTTWSTWCEQARTAGELPFGLRQANEYIRCSREHGKALCRGQAISDRAEVRIIRSQTTSKKRERWFTVKPPMPMAGEPDWPAGVVVRVSTKHRVQVTMPGCFLESNSASPERLLRSCFHAAAQTIGNQRGQGICASLTVNHSEAAG